VSLTVDELIRLIDGLEERAEGYVTLDDVQQAAGGADLKWAIDEAILLVDYRSRLDGSAVTLCRLNRRHPKVARLTAW
jgi:hypothetical protein